MRERAWASSEFAHWEHSSVSGLSVWIGPVLSTFFVGSPTKLGWLVRLSMLLHFSANVASWLRVSILYLIGLEEWIPLSEGNHLTSVLAVLSSDRLCLLLRFTSQNAKLIRYPIQVIGHRGKVSEWNVHSRPSGLINFRQLFYMLPSCEKVKEWHTYLLCIVCKLKERMQVHEIRRHRSSLCAKKPNSHPIRSQSETWESDPFFWELSGKTAAGEAVIHPKEGHVIRMGQFYGKILFGGFLWNRFDIPSVPVPQSIADIQIRTYRKTCILCSRKG